MVFNIASFSWVRATKPKVLNSIIDTSTILFMAVVGPSESGKTELIYKLLTRRNFILIISQIIFLQRFLTVLMDELNARRIGIVFVKFDKFGRLRNIENI